MPLFAATCVLLPNFQYIRGKKKNQRVVAMSKPLRIFGSDQHPLTVVNLGFNTHIESTHGGRSLKNHYLAMTYILSQSSNPGFNIYEPCVITKGHVPRVCMYLGILTL